MKKFFCAVLIGKALHSSPVTQAMDTGFFTRKLLSQAAIYDDLTRAEYELFDKYSGLKVGETIHMYDVPIDLHGKQERIHTTRSGDDQKEDLVLIHGYFVGKLSFFKMVKDLSQHYRLWTIDMVGMGLSSRPEFNSQSTEETIDYFVESIEQWRRSVGIEKFHLAGLSLGGYMSGMYALKYPDKINKLLLISPAGVSKPVPEDETNKEIMQLPWLRRKLIEYITSLWRKGYTPHDAFNSIGIFRKPFINSYVKRMTLQGDQFDPGFRYINNILLLPESTLKCLHHVLTLPRASGHVPFEDHMHKLQMPCEIYYGEKDWISSEGAYRVAAKGGLKGGIHIIPQAGHIMNFENPKYLSDLMIKHLKGSKSQK